MVEDPEQTNIETYTTMIIFNGDPFIDPVDAVGVVGAPEGVGEQAIDVVGEVGIVPGIARRDR
jgi:hypothetical protein